MSFVDIRVVITGGICVTVLCLYIIGLGYWNVTRIRPIIVTTVQTSPEQNLTINGKQIGGHSIDLSMDCRIKYLQKGCRHYDKKNKYFIRNLRDNAIFFESKKLNISVCKVPKTGSTFLATIFSILTKHRSASKAFDTPRRSMHAMSTRFSTRLRKESDNLTTRAFSIARDPYSRLFSVFIDKVYMCPQRSFEIFSKDIKKGPFSTQFGNCGYNVSFNDFLDRVTTDIVKGHEVNRHWSPIYSLCRVCNMEYQYVIKQETLTRDLEYIINQLNISSDIKTTVTEMFHEADANKTIKGIIKSMYYIRTKYIVNCSNTLAFALKLWEGFKIQGYIRSNVAFPLSSFRPESSVNADGFTKAVLTAMHTNPLSSTERKAQRRQALVKAYTSVSKRVISQIQEAYKMDFRLFGYDSNPPS